MASSWTPEGGEVTQSPGRVGAAEKLCEKRKSIEKLCETRKSIAQWQARPSKLPWVGREGASYLFCHHQQPPLRGGDARLPSRELGEADRASPAGVEATRSVTGGEPVASP